jgi:hypothetical protein
VVTLGSIPLFSKKNVGGAAVAVEKLMDGERTWTAVQFAAGSWPERLKGFNRFGATQEFVQEEAGVVRESGYLSFMTTSRETGMQEARRAYVSDSTLQSFTFAEGKASDKGCSYVIAHRQMGSKQTWCDSPELLAQAGDGAALPPEATVPGYGPNCLPTFLFAVQRVVAQGTNEAEMRYIHNGQVLRLCTEWKQEQSNSNLRKITGRTGEGSHHSEFHLWVNANSESVLPERIEFKPRGFLSLSLEAQATAGTPKLFPLLRKQS